MLAGSLPRLAGVSFRRGLRPCLPLTGLPLAIRSFRLSTRPSLPPISPYKRRHTSTGGPSPPVSAVLLHPADPPPPLTPTTDILDKVLPGWAAGAKPYLLLTRIDKPIGSILLFWPCGMSTSETKLIIKLGQ